MAPLRSLTINATPATHLRAGIKWDPLERDDIEEAYEIGSADNAREELKVLTKQIKTSERIIRFLRFLTLFYKAADRYERLRGQQLARKKLLEKYLAQAKMPSFDLDLCCFCYDRDNKLVEYVSPVLMETQDEQSRMAFMHSGDDSTGTGDAFDEELLVKLAAIKEKIYQVFFVVISINHGFDQIKGGFCSIVNTSGEQELLATKLRTPLKHRVHVMAKLSRGTAGWVLDEISEYLPLMNHATIPLHIRLDELLTKQYLTPPKQPVPVAD